MTHEQLEAKRALQGQIRAVQERLLGENLTAGERQAEADHLVGLVEKLMAVEEPAPPVPNAEIAKLSPEEAAKRAAAIRERPEFWNRSGTLDKEGNPVISRERHEALTRELVELDARGAETPADAGDV